VVDPAELGARAELFASPRVAARARLTPALVVKGSAGRYFRAPTLIELFGDRGVTVGNPALRAETGESVDVGAAYAPAAARGPLDRIHVQAALFASTPRDTIALVPTAGRAATARNLGGAIAAGAEAGASARVGCQLALTAHYSLLLSRQRSELVSYAGKRLPQRPLHQAYGRADWARRPWRRLAVLWADASLTSGSYLDAANTARVPARLLLGGGVKLAVAPGLLIAVEGKNLFDARVADVPAPPPLETVPRAVSDFLGYPLPGRSFYARVDWTF
jgi:iron complex outermembrane receptor protein